MEKKKPQQKNRLKITILSEKEISFSIISMIFRCCCYLIRLQSEIQLCLWIECRDLSLLIVGLLNLSSILLRDGLKIIGRSRICLKQIDEFISLRNVKQKHLLIRYKFLVDSVDKLVGVIF